MLACPFSFGLGLRLVNARKLKRHWEVFVGGFGNEALGFSIGVLKPSFGGKEIRRFYDFCISSPKDRGFKKHSISFADLKAAAGSLWIF